MARGVELGVAYLTIAAETRGLVSDIGKALSQTESVAGASGRRIGQSIKQGVEAAKPVDTSALTKKVEDDQKRLAAAVEVYSRRQEDATRKVEIAHQRLKETREKSTSTTSQVMQAEERFRQAIERSKNVAAEARAKQELYASAVTKSKDDLFQAEKKNRELARGIAEAARQAEEAERKYKGFGGSVRKSMDEARTAIKQSWKGSFDQAKAEVDQAERKFDGFGDSVQRSLAVAKGTIKNSLNGAFAPAEVEAKQAGTKDGGGFATSFKGAVAGLGAYFGATEIIGGIGQSIQSAGELEQSIGAIDVVFKDSAGQMHQWAQSAAESVGLSENQYNTFASTLGASLKNAGTPMDQLADKTDGLIGLGSDMASMYGGTTAEAIDAISAALRGEMDPIERYGVSLNESALDAEAMAMGIEKTGGAFTNQQKQLIVQSLLMKQTADAQGNFNREQDTFAHKQQVAAAQWENLKAAMGEKFLPVATQVMGWITETAIPAIENFAKFTSDLYNNFVSTADIWGPFAVGIGIVAGAMAIWLGVAVPLAAAMTDINWPIVLIVGAIGLLVGAIIYAYQNFTWFRDGVTAVWGWIKSVIAGFVDWWTQVAWPAILTGLQWIGDKFVWLYQNVVLPVWGFITAVISGFVNWLTTVAIPWVSGALQTLGGWFSWLNDVIIQPVWYAIRVTIAAVVAVILTIFQGLAWVVTNVLAPPFVWLWQNVISPVFSWIWDKISGFGGWFSTTAVPQITGAVDWLKNAFQWLWDKVSAVWTWIRDKVQQFATWFIAALLPYITAGLDLLKLAFHWLWDKVSAVFSWIWDKIQRFATWFVVQILPYIMGALDLLKAAFHWLWDKVSAVWSWISDKISRTWNWIRDVVLSPAINWLKSIFGPAWDWMSDKIGRVWDWVGDKISRTWNWIRDNVLTPMERFLNENVVDAFRRSKDGIGRVWDEIKAKVSAPVEKVINVVINDGFISNYNKVAKKFGVDPLEPVHFNGLATGGIVGQGYARGGILPGYQSKKKDELLTPMRKGEGVLVPEAVRALGADFIHGVNGAANSGGIRGAQEWKKKHGVAAGDGHDHGAPAGAYGWAGSSFKTSGATPPSGGSGIWGSFQASASRAGAMSFPDKNFMGVSTKRAAQAWMGRSALNVNTDGKGPGVSVGYGNHGPWGFNSGSSVQVNPSAPGNMVLSILMHEFGHALSLDHTNNGASIMHPAIAGVRSPSASDYSALVSAWGKPGAGVKTYDVNGGEGGFDFGAVVKEFFDATVGKVIDKSLDGFKSLFPGNHFVNIGVNAVKKMVDDALAFVTSNGDGADSGESGGDWTSTIKDALKRTGLPVRDDYINMWKKQVQTESGGNPRAVNNWDINAINGNPSKGLAQVVPSTFAQYRDKSLPDDIFDPLANLVAAMNYAKARYGSSGMFGAIGQGHGYALGGIVDMPKLYDNGGLISGKGLRLIDHQRSTPDYVLTSSQWNMMRNIAENSHATQHQGQNINITVPEREGIDPNTMGRRIGESLAFELNKVGAF